MFRKRNKGMEHESSQMLAIDLTREALRNYLGLSLDWLPHWLSFNLKLEPITEVSLSDEEQRHLGVHTYPECKYVYDAERTIRIKGWILEPHIGIGENEVACTWVFRRYPRLMRTWLPYSAELRIEGNSSTPVICSFTLRTKTDRGINFTIPVMGPFTRV